ncbi:MAG: glycogen debranching enzyme N-terminal domain-containing protein [Verrucomicrobia bacterium]|jgi:predicted glycogen debranching enzyme|nr:glycogen debranching enzyme N-terminal domain-containing protein [Verrucomicrobiota bacterium]
MEKKVIRMIPAPGANLVRFVGDRIRFELRDAEGGAPAPNDRAFLRTNLGRAKVLRQEIIKAHSEGASPAGASMHDIPMLPGEHGWHVELALAETGFFQAKAYRVDGHGWQHWPEGPNFGLSVHPDYTRSGNTIYCAFVRMFGATRHKLDTGEPGLEDAIRQLDQSGYTVIPPSGTLRDLLRELPHMVNTLGCRIVHLLPVNRVPTTYARFGRFGSPYAALDLAGIDPALVEFDRRTTGVDQFRELTAATHDLGARVFLDIVINHTGWGSVYHEAHPEWFLRNTDGTFKSPGAWGNTWEDLVELRHQNVSLWDEISGALLTWCRRGVDGFRCDAGYMVPVTAWQYIIARVQQEFPDAVFLLEGLGGAWEATRALLTQGGMQWAYSELFQNQDGVQVSGYLDHALTHSPAVGTLVHYSETHDNDRLAKRGRRWSLLRNRLCALSSSQGAFGFTCGVEWLAPEKVNVHSSRGLAWGNPDNLLPELSSLTRLLAEHPCFFDGATVKRLSPAGSPILVLWRESESRQDAVLVLVNLDERQTQTLTLKRASLPETLRSRLSEASLDVWVELLGQSLPHRLSGGAEEIHLKLDAAFAGCLSPTRTPAGLSGDSYRAARARAAWALQALCTGVPAEQCGSLDWQWLADQVDHDPAALLCTTSQLSRRNPKAPGVPLQHEDIARQIESVHDGKTYPNVVVWTLRDATRVTPVPSGHWLLLEDEHPFRVTLELPAGGDAVESIHLESIAAAGRHIACVSPRDREGSAPLQWHRRGSRAGAVEATLSFLASGSPALNPSREALADGLVLLTNGRGGMARICVDLGRVRSKYDCVLGANLHPAFPVDRHVLAKRIRVWVNANGFLSALDARNLMRFEPGPPARWHFAAHAGDGHCVDVVVEARMVAERNTTVFRFSRPLDTRSDPRCLPTEADVRLTVRVDIEDRNFHWETRRNGAAEHHFQSNLSRLKGAAGFLFKPARDRHLSVGCTAGNYHPAPEWSENLPHPVEQSRGQTGSGDAFSPGWFEIPLGAGSETSLVVSAESDAAADAERSWPPPSAHPTGDAGVFGRQDAFGRGLLQAARAFVVRRDDGRTVIAGYPWFLDWGRDSLIAARGLLAGGLVEEVRDLAVVFARFEERGTLPNTIHGSDASNRDTSDAPLWFGVVCEELAATLGQTFYQTVVGPKRRTIHEVLTSIAAHFIEGTPNRIRMDPASALIWSPSHFTWMDTNYPAGTPREGYPVEIQALWIRLLRQLARLNTDGEAKRWSDLARQAEESLNRWFWSDQAGWFADVLLAEQGKPAAQATRDDALRSNCLAVVGLGLVGGDRARKTVEAARRHLVIPGALRSLAPLPVAVPLPIRAPHGELLNDPKHPYWRRYEGDEDTRRKPAYHNGTAWTWTFPLFCEAMAMAWEFEPAAVRAAQGYLASLSQLMEAGCLGQIPEILDGDVPHTQRGCDAQAWGVTEAIRVWRLLWERQAP